MHPRALLPGAAAGLCASSRHAPASPSGSLLHPCLAVFALLFDPPAGPPTHCPACSGKKYAKLVAAADLDTQLAKCVACWGAAARSQDAWVACCTQLRCISGGPRAAGMLTWSAGLPLRLAACPAMLHAGCSLAMPMSVPPAPLPTTD